MILLTQGIELELNQIKMYLCYFDAWKSELKSKWVLHFDALNWSWIEIILLDCKFKLEWNQNHFGYWNVDLELNWNQNHEAK